MPHGGHRGRGSSGGQRGEESSAAEDLSIPQEVTPTVGSAVAKDPQQKTERPGCARARAPARRPQERGASGGARKQGSPASASSNEGLCDHSRSMGPSGGSGDPNQSVLWSARVSEDFMSPPAASSSTALRRIEPLSGCSTGGPAASPARRPPRARSRRETGEIFEVDCLKSIRKMAF